jgi:hypothetical protein
MLELRLAEALDVGGNKMDWLGLKPYYLYKCGPATT